MSFHLLRSWAKLFNSCSPVFQQLTVSSIHSVHGLPLLFVPSTIPNIGVFNFLLSSILHTVCGQTVRVSSEWLFVADPFQFWVCHMGPVSVGVHGLLFALSNWYVESFGNSTSQMPADCLIFLLYFRVTHPYSTVLNAVVSNIHFLCRWWCSYLSKSRCGGLK